jgi:hypothetical protein
MLRRFGLYIVLFGIAASANGFEIKFETLRTTLSRPDTSHSLTFKSPVSGEEKSVYLLTPVAQERLGAFVDINGIEIGYATDITNGVNETDTLNILLSYRKLKHTRITFNYQVLEGLETEAQNLRGPGSQTRFAPRTKSTRIELFGLHNFYTFGGRESLFEHFFLNRPYQNDGHNWALSIVGGWSIKRLELTSPDSILFTPDFFTDDAPAVTELESDSISGNIGPFLSMNFANNINAFVEYKIGGGYIRNRNEESGLKGTGDEKVSALGGGVSWTSKNQKHLVFLRAWEQKGKYIDTSFGDLSYVYYF